MMLAEVSDKGGAGAGTLIDCSAEADIGAVVEKERKGDDGEIALDRQA